METTETKNTEMAEKLAAAGEKAEQAKAARRERVVKGSHLLPKLLEQATAAGLNLDEMSGFTKLTGPDKRKRVLVAKKGGRVDLSGFTVEAAAIKQISEQEARDKHLGKVRGQIDFNKADDEVLAAFSAACTELKNSVAPAVKEKKEEPEAAPEAAPTTEA